MLGREHPAAHLGPQRTQKPWESCSVQKQSAAAVAPADPGTAEGGKLVNLIYR